MLGNNFIIAQLALHVSMTIRNAKRINRSRRPFLIVNAPLFLLLMKIGGVSIKQWNACNKVKPPTEEASYLMINF